MTPHPYPGLRPFQRHETDIFFGRETHTIQLLERLEQTHFLAVLGPSGYGKSSLVRTGLLASLEGGMLPSAGAHWWIADMRPGHIPLERLAEALVHLTGREGNSQEALLHQKALEKHLRRGPYSVHEIFADINPGRDTQLLLLVDQFEELFRLAQPRSKSDVTAFISLLLAAAKHPNI